MNSKLYKIIDKKKSKELIFLKSIIERKIKQLLPKFNKDLSKLHKFVDSEKINNIRLQCFHELNSKFGWENIL